MGEMLSERRRRGAELEADEVLPVKFLGVVSTLGVWSKRKHAVQAVSVVGHCYCSGCAAW